MRYEDEAAADGAANRAEDGAANGNTGGSGVVRIGSMSGGAVAAGYGARAVDMSGHGPAPATSAQAELLDAVRTLREQLALLVPSEETAGVAGELARVEEEIAGTGRADAGRLSRLRELLGTGAGAVSGLAAAVAVTQAIAQVLA
ncbi:hypothetical protein HUT18_07675 [Streptomyces sp. NA04227]|uniref:hypothetical protein n=1 Tax=Streptomyces sp. NA04227 TaxID=2742136 RepID=UPI00158FC3CA|nr:hypothetical protein [Streptomyces sp. NA04227]QKW06300.1 hypothetical protein HUT18_07675 [Streptomyces sp. NA04227]